MNESNTRRRRRRRGNKKKSDSEVDAPSGSLILSEFARNTVLDSSPDSIFSIPPRKVSSLELDTNISDDMHFSTATPGSQDSALSVWDLGSVEDDILSSPKGIVFPHAFEIGEEKKSISSLLEDIQTATRKISKLAQTNCIPKQRLCISVPPDNGVASFLTNVSTSVSSGLDYITKKLIDSQIALPASWAPVLDSLTKQEDIGDEAPVLNRRQRRLRHV